MGLNYSLVLLYCPLHMMNRVRVRVTWLAGLPVVEAGILGRWRFSIFAG